MNDRIGEHLWSEWDGELYEGHKQESIIYYTYEHIDVDTDIVKRGLASALQRDGVADSLSDAFKLLEESVIVYGYSGYDIDAIFPLYCDADGETFYGDILETYLPTTFIEI